MADYHVHIGQFENVYYYADRVFRSLAVTLTDEVWFSSTTSCLYCKESPAAKANPAVAKHAPTARELYKAVCDEVEEAVYAAGGFGIEAHPLYWVVPDVHIAAAFALSLQWHKKTATGILSTKALRFTRGRRNGTCATHRRLPLQKRCSRMLMPAKCAS